MIRRACPIEVYACLEYRALEVRSRPIGLSVAEEQRVRLWWIAGLESQADRKRFTQEIVCEIVIVGACIFVDEERRNDERPCDKSEGVRTFDFRDDLEFIYGVESIAVLEDDFNVTPLNLERPGVAVFEVDDDGEKVLRLQLWSKVVAHGAGVEE